MIKEEYSPFKVVHFQERLARLKEGKPINPVHLQIVPTNKCNSRCPMCAYRLEGYTSNQTFKPNDEIPKDKLIEIIEAAHWMGVRAIQFTGGGEPLVHPDIKEVFTYALDRGFKCALVTNGVLLDHDLSLILSDFAWVRVSVDAADPITYKRVRGLNGEVFNKVLNNIARLVAMRRTGTVGVGYVVFQENAHAIEKAAMLYKSIGVDNFRISAGFTPEGYAYHTPHLDLAIKASQGAVDKFSYGDFTVFNNFKDRIRDLFEGFQDYDFCPMKDFMTYVGADLNVYTCCTLAYNERGLIGQIRNRSLGELWKSKDKERFFTRHNPKVDCRHPCMYLAKNEFINYCLSKNPKHVEFL
jgi:MoaA/NifB/PqqE/SkfB family radical SAM enzyme